VKLGNGDLDRALYVGGEGDRRTGRHDRQWVLTGVHGNRGQRPRFDELRIPGESGGNGGPYPGSSVAGEWPARCSP
jgi:hypothetical protein